MTSSLATLGSSRRSKELLFAGVGVSAALLWSYWSTIQSLLHEWLNDPNYSVGLLVPIAAVYLVWLDRAKLGKLDIKPCLWGLPVIGLGEIGRTIGLIRVTEAAERYGLVLVIAGLVLLIAGKAVFQRLFWVLAFLLLMPPLPGVVHNAIAGPLQGMATRGSVFVLELMGIAVLNEGNVLLIDGEHFAVAEACSGLRMLTAFIVVGCVLAMVVDRPRLQKAVLVGSTIPVAIACNLTRLVCTVLLFKVTNADVAKTFFHDFAGWTMMPLAVVMLLVELWILGKLFVTAPSTPSGATSALSS